MNPAYNQWKNAVEAHLLAINSNIRLTDYLLLHFYSLDISPSRVAESISEAQKLLRITPTGEVPCDSRCKIKPGSRVIKSRYCTGDEVEQGNIGTVRGNQYINGREDRYFVEWDHMKGVLNGVLGSSLVEI